MIYGRVIGNELRDIPPECLPVWGQRWSTYRAPHGPSPFSTHVFTVNGMSEVGPVLTSPSQFEVMLTDEDDGEDTSSESNRLYSSFHMHVGSIEPMPCPEMQTPQSSHPFPSRPHSISSIMRRSTGRPPPPSSACSTTALFPRQHSEQSSSRHHALEPGFPPPPHHTSPIQNRRESLVSDFGLRGMNRTSLNTLSRVGSSHASFVPGGRSQYTTSPPSAPQSLHAHVHPYPSNPLSNPDSNYFLRSLPEDIQAGFIPVVSPSSLHCFSMPPDQQNVGVDSLWDHDSSSARMPNVTHPRNPMTAQWQSGSVSPTLGTYSGPSETSESSSLGSAWGLRHLISDHRNSSLSQNLPDICPAEDCMPTPFGNPGSSQFSR